MSAFVNNILKKNFPNIHLFTAIWLTSLCPCIVTSTDVAMLGNWSCFLLNEIKETQSNIKKKWEN